MEADYTIITLVIAAVILLIVWLIRKNRRDRKDFEKTMNASDIKPEQHKDDQI